MSHNRQDGLSIATLSYAAVVVLVFIVIKGITARRGDGAPLPPGPKPLPIIGNLLDIPFKNACVAYSNLSKKYGDIMHFKVLGQVIIVINSQATAVELLEKRARIYSDRPTIPMAELMGWEFNTGLLQYGDEWRQHRRAFQHVLRKDVSSAYYPMQTTKIREMLKGVLTSPDKFATHLQTLSVAIVMAAMYGHDVKSDDDALVDIAERTAEAGSRNLLPGARLVNHFPILRHVPSWFPGAGFHQVAAECYQLTRDLKDIPFKAVRANMLTGTHQPSAMSRLLERNDARGGSPYIEEIIKGVAATAYGAAADTTSASAIGLILAMILFPDVQKQAQAELDRVIGQDRLPDLNDRPMLPYMEAMYREILRWAPPAPLGVVHSSTEDDIFEGYLIPKGSIIIPNIWSMTHNEEFYPDPHQFRPERFLKPDGSLNDDSDPLAYGFGRRNCPGRHMASATVWLTTASFLATFSIRHAKDNDGYDIPVKAEWSDGIIMHPKPFECSITPRSSKVAELVARYEHGSS